MRQAAGRRMTGLILALVGILFLPPSNARAQATPGRLGLGPTTIRGSWIGQDGNDLVGWPTALKGNDVQDIHLLLRGLPADRTVVFVSVQGLGGGEWQFRGDGPFNPWRVALVRAPKATMADLYLDPYQPENGRPMTVTIRYDDGTTAAFQVRGGRADPNLRMPQAKLKVQWIGQDRQDWTGPGPSVGPDGLQDVHLALTQLSPQVEIQAVEVAVPGGTGWHYGQNPKGLSNAEFIRQPGEPSQAGLFFSLDRLLNGKALTVTVSYAGGKTDRATVASGRADPSLRMPPPAPVRVVATRLTPSWKGQDGVAGSNPGDVHIALSGLPAGRSIAAAALSDAVRGFWVFRANDRVAFTSDPDARPLVLRRGPDPTQADLFFPPYRDETRATMTLRLLWDDGTTAIASFPGGPCDLGLRAPRPDPGTVVARPGDDLNALVGRSGTVRLTRGQYRLDRPLVLSRPVTLTAEPGATLLFAQKPEDAPWTTAIKIHHGHTTLEGFAVRFAGPVRWNQEVGFGPAVLGTTDNLDQGPSGLKVNLVLRKLDLEAPPAATSWEEATRLMRLVTGENGRVEGNVLKGGMIEFRNGPWAFVDNEHRGAPPHTYAWTVFGGHHVYDLVVQGNRAHTVAPAGKTWRFLVLTTSGFEDEVRDNEVAGLGPRDDDTVPATNAPEVILTEAYNVRFEGRPSGRSADGRIVSIGPPQGEPARVGDVVSILSGPQAGQWIRIAQPIDATTYLLEAPLPAGDYVISIATGFVREVYERNTVDSRGSSGAVNLVLAGNHYGTRVVHNHLLGAGETLRFTAFPTEQPRHWGWSHAPMFGGVIEGNIFEDSARGATICVIHTPMSKTSRGRVYLTAAVKDNTAVWTPAFLGRRDRSQTANGLVAFTVGDALALDPCDLVLTAQGNRVQVPEGTRPGPIARVEAAHLNGRPVVGKTLDLPSAAPAATTGVRVEGSQHR